MVREETAETFVYDPISDVARVTCSVASHAGSTRRRARVDLLLNAAGHLVGIDLGGAGFQRLVVMLGPHEAVASTQPAEVEITSDARGCIAEIAIPSARAAVQADRGNPYRS